MSISRKPCRVSRNIKTVLSLKLSPAFGQAYSNGYGSNSHEACLRFHFAGELSSSAADVRQYPVRRIFGESRPATLAPRARAKQPCRCPHPPTQQDQIYL